jgi:rhamnose utilization protein RhaD (predicted bifunctional aldolase and dehydrogenase)/NAD(P)-dependent dehydrogenase (short-subunit alcohol dehydrogenase family)
VNVGSPSRGESPAEARLNELLAISHLFGRDPEFARAGGGNSSVKVDGVLYIKPSGSPLAELTAESVIGLRLDPLLRYLDEAPDGDGGSEAVFRIAAEARVGSIDARRPSVELLFHALLPEPLVIHTHPTIVNAFTCSAAGRAAAERLFGDELLWIPYTDPGVPLARTIRAARAEWESSRGRPAPRIVLMANHGLIVAGESPAEITAASQDLVARMRAHLDSLPAADWGAADRLDPAAATAALRVVGPALRALLASGRRLGIVTFDDTEAGIAASSTPLGRGFAAQGPLTPDQIVYAGSFPLVVEPPSAAATGPASWAGAAPEMLADAARDALAARRAAGLDEPKIVLVPGLGLFAAGASYAGAETARDIFLDAIRVSADAHRLGGVRPLDALERGFIETWESEAYRKRVASGATAAGRAKGLVALVTGAAQGFGLAIAQDLAAQGGHVVLADINADLAGREADALVERLGPGRAMPIKVDVGDDASVGAAIEQVVRRYGGLDLLVSNAGILRAGSVMSQPVAEFDAVTKINYRGFFLCTRQAAPVMAVQHRFRPDYLADIVEINSKSGLEGSSRNFAYAGSKFGGIGLTQSFALELVSDGVKVNAICPGNFLDGPLWSDPENGLFVQYLRQGKVPGAKTLEDVRHYYEGKVPMGRGCTPEDVLEALYYVVAQRYETGQAIAVTGGQVMLR